MRRAARLLLVGALAGAPVAALADGAELFETNCAICHNSGGIGTPGLAPALDRPAFWQALGDRAPTYISTIVTKGFNAPITVRGERFAGMPMLPVATATDDELAQIASWVLSGLGGLERTVSPEDIAAARTGDLDNAGLRAMRPQTE